MKSTNRITAYKGFDENFQCRGFQYEVGKSYEHDGNVKLCETGFHACTTILDVWGYYAPANSRFAEVTLDGISDTGRDNNDSKVAAAKITIEAELSLPEFIKKAVSQIVSAAKTTKKLTGDLSAATNTGNRSAATNTGDLSAASVEGENSIAVSSGLDGRAKASKGSAIVLCEYDNVGALKKIHSAIAGTTKGIKPDVWYQVQDGKLVEVKS